MTKYRPRLFASDPDVARVGEGLLSRNLPRDEWTHEAHLAATTYLLIRHPEIDLDKELPQFICRYNESVAGVNSDSEGYHETITRVFLHGVRLFLSEVGSAQPLNELVNGLLLSPMGRRDWPLRFYSRERLFSLDARRHFIEPDLAALPEPTRAEGHAPARP